MYLLDFATGFYIAIGAQPVFTTCMTTTFGVASFRCTTPRTTTMSNPRTRRPIYMYIWTPVPYSAFTATGWTAPVRTIGTEVTVRAILAVASARPGGMFIACASDSAIILTERNKIRIKQQTITTSTTSTWTYHTI